MKGEWAGREMEAEKWGRDTGEDVGEGTEGNYPQVPPSMLVTE
jgi:hypothetical protein